MAAAFRLIADAAPPLLPKPGKPAPPPAGNHAFDTATVAADDATTNIAANDPHSVASMG